jgi:hypothetical protein
MRALFQAFGSCQAHRMAGDPFHPLFVFLGQSFEKSDHTGGVDLRPLE